MTGNGRIGSCTRCGEDLYPDTYAKTPGGLPVCRDQRLGGDCRLRVFSEKPWTELEPVGKGGQREPPEPPL